MINRKMTHVYLLSGIAVIITALGIFFSSIRAKEAAKRGAIVTGLSKGQVDYIQKEMNMAFTQQSYIDAGNKMLKDGNIDGAIESYKKALSTSKMSGEKGQTWVSIANAYEKRRDYKNALEWMMIARDHCPEWSRKPDTERVRYLEYALQGNYESVIEHARNAVKEIENIETRLKDTYIARLNDLIAAKEYILSLKTKGKD